MIAFALREILAFTPNYFSDLGMIMDCELFRFFLNWEGFSHFGSIMHRTILVTVCFKGLC